MRSLAATRMLGLYLGLLLVTPALTAPAKAGQARCLFEIGDEHYIGSVCEFKHTDKKGSFRITATTGSDIEAEVQVTAAGEGVASWSNPHEGGHKESLGDVKQAGRVLER